MVIKHQLQQGSCAFGSLHAWAILSIPTWQRPSLYLASRDESLRAVFAPLLKAASGVELPCSGRALSCYFYSIRSIPETCSGRHVFFQNRALTGSDLTTSFFWWLRFITTTTIRSMGCSWKQTSARKGLENTSLLTLFHHLCLIPVVSLRHLSLHHCKKTSTV